MAEEGIDISNEVPKNIALFQQDTFDYVIIVCKETEDYGTCPVFFGITKERLNLEIEDPAQAHGNEKDRLNRYRSIRDTIKAFAIDFAHKISF